MNCNHCGRHDPEIDRDSDDQSEHYCEDCWNLINSLMNTTDAQEICDLANDLSEQ